MIQWQIYSMTVTMICDGFWLVLWNILEWPKDRSGQLNRLLLRSMTRWLHLGEAGTDVVRIYGGVTRSLEQLDSSLDWIYARKPLIDSGQVMLTACAHECQASGFDGGTVLAASQMVTTEDHHWVFYEVHIIESIHTPLTPSHRLAPGSTNTGFKLARQTASP